ncbi:Glycosyltransferase involved in cell wall bisynthesis [Evansella caseinilytica]|uniref:Glycosyltransferase involved in cell wall bisynthesis n=1 Tax=Evansella caseinilytica TaxID=1503961 RepID=A0A1H3HPI1_9BACI|nr:Glycosyltransferase involved in cell wall bisynthesis [Evansella caseinilytica]
MKVLHLPYGIGISAFAGALRTKGIDAVSCSLRRHHYSYLADIRKDFDQHPPEKQERLREQFFQEAMEKYDIFHFHFGETFFPDRRDLEILKKNGKKMIVHHRGSEVRMLSVAKGMNNPYVKVKRSWPEEKVRANLEFLSRYFDKAIVNDWELRTYTEPYYKKNYVVPHAIEIKKFTARYPTGEERPLIVHAPSRRDTKGTEYVLDAVDRLKKAGEEFDFQLVEKLPHDQALKLYQKATIVIDQLRIGAYGHLSMEAMAMGKPVICYIREDLVDKYPAGLPIISANPDTVHQVIRKTLKHPERWRELGRAGRRYANMYHRYERVADRLISIYQKL